MMLGMVIDTVKKVLFTPGKFFTSLAKRKHHKIVDALRFLLIVGAFYVVMSLLVELVFSAIGVSLQGMFGSNMDRAMMPFFAGFRSVFAVFGAIISYASIVVGSFITALIIWLWLMLWGGKGDYQKAYAFAIYTMTPWLVLGWLPGINVLAAIWQLVLMIFATMVLYKFSKTRAVLVWVLPLVLLFLLVAFLVGGLVAMGILMAFIASRR